MFEEDPDQLPPPSYQMSQEDFEQKTSLAVNHSLAVVPSTEEEGWEVWDEAVFEAAAARNLGAAPSSSAYPLPPPRRSPQRPPEKLPIIEEPAVGPLKIVKKSKSKAFSSLSNVPSRGRADVPSTYHQNTVGAHVIPQPDTHWDTPSNDLTSLSRSMSIMSTRRTPPPQFDPIGPSLDGPPYEEQSGEIILRYEPEGSRAASPLSDRVISFIPSRAQTSQRAAPCVTSVSPNPSHRQAISNSQRPPQFNKFRSSRRNPPLISKFDPMSAYSSTPSQPSRYAESPPKVDTSALYASAVSAHLPSKAVLGTTSSKYQPTTSRQNISQHEAAYGGTYNDNFPESRRSRVPSISSSSISSESSLPFINEQPRNPNRRANDPGFYSMQPNR